MPSVSEAQRRAMRAAEAGKGTLGIPKKVGKKFVAADKKAGARRLPKRTPKKKVKVNRRQ